MFAVARGRARRGSGPRHTPPTRRHSTPRTRRPAPSVSARRSPGSSASARSRWANTAMRPNTWPGASSSARRCRPRCRSDSRKGSARQHRTSRSSVLSVDPPDAEVFVDGKAVGRVARVYTLFVEPGLHMVRARAPGREDAFQVLARRGEGGARDLASCAARAGEQRRGGRAGCHRAKRREPCALRRLRRRGLQAHGLPGRGRRG